MEIKVYNADQIGGNYTTISASGKTIMIDYGQELPGTTKSQEKFDWEHVKVDAVFFSHYHGDHVGRILEVPENVPIYVGEASREVMLNIHRALAGVPSLKDEQKKYVDLLESERVHVIRENEPMDDIAGMTITPYSVDHSAYDAYMYLVEADGEVALHTGDYRGHGYRGKNGQVLLDVIKYYIHKNGRKVDYLITEGTMMGDRSSEKVLTELELQMQAKEIFAKHRHVFLVVSSTNLDSIASFYHAAKQNGMKMFCYSNYLKAQLETFSKYAGKKTPLYKMDDVYKIDFDRKLKNKMWDKPKTSDENIRGYGILENSMIEKVKGLFLTNEYHPLVTQSVIDLLNKNKSGMEFYRLPEYDYEEMRKSWGC